MPILFMLSFPSKLNSIIGISVIIILSINLASRKIKKEKGKSRDRGGS